jgi:hypothetical protein
LVPSIKKRCVVMRMSKQQLQEAVAATGGYELIDDDDDKAATAAADAAAASGSSYTTETVDDLRKRYLGDSTVSDDGLLVGSSDAPDEPAAGSFEDELVVVRPKGNQAAFGHGPGPKSIVISGKDGKPLGAQG